MWTVWLLICSRAFFSPLKTWKKDKIKGTQRNETLSLYCTALGFINKKEKYITPNKTTNGRYFEILILQKVVDQQKIINLNAVITHFYFQCARMTMNISTSGGLTSTMSYSIFSVFQNPQIYDIYNVHTFFL